MPRIEVVKIESGFDIPSSRERYPLRKMQVGESFSISVEKRNIIANMASRIKRETGMQYTTRLVDEDGVRKLRVWRVK